MLSSVTVDVDGKAHVFRLTTRGMKAVERRLDQSIIELLSGLETSPRVSSISELLRESMNDGAGASEEEVDALMDALGFAEAAQVLGDVATAAFPEAPAEKN